MFKEYLGVPIIFIACGVLMAAHTLVAIGKNYPRNKPLKVAVRVSLFTSALVVGIYAYDVGTM